MCEATTKRRSFWISSTRRTAACSATNWPLCLRKAPNMCFLDPTLSKFASNVLLVLWKCLSGWVGGGLRPLEADLDHHMISSGLITAAALRPLIRSGSVLISCHDNKQREDNSKTTQLGRETGSRPPNVAAAAADSTSSGVKTTRTRQRF